MKILFRVLLLLVLAGDAYAESAGVEIGGDHGDTCFEATIYRLYVSDMTTPPSDTTTVTTGLTFLTWADSNKVYSPLSAESTVDAEGLEESSSNNIANWSLGKLPATGTMRLEVDISGSYSMGSEQIGQFNRFNITLATCPNFTTLKGGDIWVKQSSTSRMFHVERTLDVSDGECFGVVVSGDQSVANATLTLHSILVHVTQVSTDAIPCR